MAEERNQPFGGILIAIGVMLLALVFFSRALNLPLNPVTAILEEFLLLPLILIFVGRSLRRRERRAADARDAAATPPPRPAPARTPPQRSAPPARTAQAPRPAPIVVAPLPVATGPSSTPRPERTEALSRLEPSAMSSPEPSPEPSSKASPKLAPSRSPSPTVKGGHSPKSSEEMIAEAKARLTSNR